MFFCSTSSVGRRISLSSNHSANERLLQISQWKAATLQSPSFLQWTLCLRQFPWTPPFFDKWTFLSLVLWTCTWFAIKPHVSNCNLFLFLNKLILLEKYVAISLFMVNTSNWTFTNPPNQGPIWSFWLYYNHYQFAKSQSYLWRLPSSPHQ